ncbi:Glutathione S-transferase [Mycena venus]|uniref:glutathione transferase n=1 Tax=Mycena venus TaxID=2733690 RepID=A0A8H6XY11_9AGAR|nr:Glutathione S-transferase [Mycena venus]
MVLKIHGNPRSTCTKRVAVVLLEKGVPFELITVSMDDAKTPEYKANLQPFGQVPVLEDEGYFLFESRAMGRYVALKYADQGTPGLIPIGGDLQETCNFEKAMAIEATQFLAAEQLISEAIIKPYKGETINPDEVARLTAQLEGKMQAYEQILSKTKYLAGDHLTLADLYHLPYAHAVTNVLKSDLLTSKPSVARWFHDISSRPSWLAVKDLVQSTA